MAIVRFKDPFSIMPRSLWPTFWSDEDVWQEEKEGMSVYENDNDVMVKANVPGIPADNIDISLEGGTLTIKGEYTETEEEQNKKKTVYRESRQARYYYTTSLPHSVDADKIKAEVADGVLTVTLPKTETSKAKKIKVKQIK